METSRTRVRASLFNIFEVVGWSYVLFDTIFNIYEDPKKIMNFQAENTFARALFATKIVLTAQFLDFVLNKGNFMTVFAQYIGRMVVAWLFLNEKTPSLALACTLISWSLTDIIRYTFYIHKGPYTSFLRNDIILNISVRVFNSFMVLFPIAVFAGEIPCMESFLKHLNKEKDPEFYESQYFFTRVVQVGVVIDMILLSKFLFQARKSEYDYLNSEIHRSSTRQKSTFKLQS